MPLRQLYPDPQAAKPTPSRVDIFAVHGLNPRGKDDDDHGWDTWRTPPGPNGRLWLRDDLPQYTPEARIFLFVYESTAVFSKDKDAFIGKASHLLESIRAKRDGIESRPLLFFGHSMGGLLIKQALINANNNPKYAAIKSATVGLVFFATPHHGADTSLLSLGKAVAKVAKAFGFQKGSGVLHVLDKGSIFSEIMGEHWRHQQDEYEVVSFWGARDEVVPQESARLGLPGDRESIVKLDADHRQVCKFGDTQADRDNFELVVVNLRDIYRKALKSGQTHIVPLHLPSQTRKPCYHLPFRKNKRFVGREKVLGRLGEMIFEEECQKLAIYGLGGVGKTQIALQFAHWVKENKPEYSVFWAPALSASTFEQAYTEIATKLSLSKEGDDEDIKESVRRFLSSDSAGQWILIVDNADDINVMLGDRKTQSGLSQYIPESDQGVLLYTTRSRELALSVAETDLIELQQLNAQEAEDLLQRSLIRKELLGNETATRDLLERLGCLPLAITQAAAYLNKNQISITKYLALLQGTEQDLVGLMTREFVDNTRYKESHNAVATTWLVSFDQIQKEDERAAKLLEFVSCIEPKAIPRSILPELGSEEEMTNAIGTLSGYTFIAPRSDDTMFDMHSLVHLATRVWIQQKGRAQYVAEESMAHLDSIFPSDNWKNHIKWREYIPHASRALQGKETVNMDERYCLMSSVASCLTEDGRIREAMMYIEQCHEWMVQHFEETHPDRLESQAILAQVATKSGQVKRAIELLERVVHIREGILAEDHPDRLASQHALAAEYESDGQVQKAIKLLERIVDIEGDILAENHPSRLASQHALATAYRSNGQVTKAIELLERIVDIEGDNLAENHPSRLVSQHALAMAYNADGKILRAIEILRHVVAVEANTLPEGHPSRRISQLALEQLLESETE